MSKHKSADSLLDDALSKAPEFTLSDGFADKVMERISTRQVIFDRRIYLVTTFASLLFVVLAGICTVIFIDGQVLAQVGHIAWWIIPAGLFIAVIQYLDNRLVKRKLVDH